MKVYYQLNSEKQKVFTALAALFSGILFLPFLVFAGAADVTLLGGTEITANDVTVTLEGSTAESLTVNAGNFTVDLLDGSSVEITASGRNKFTVDPSSRQESFTCGSSESVLVLKGPSSGSDTVTVTPSSDTCSSGGGGGVSGGGGGGGGGGASVAVAPTPAPAVAQPSPVAQLVSPVFNQTLRAGMSHSDIKRLQQLLNSDPDTQIASSGVGSSGNETNYFGSLTEAAVQKFQAKHGVVSSGTPDTTGFGLVGPATRAKLQEVFGTVAAPAVALTPTAPPATPSVSADPELAQIVELFIALGIIPDDKVEQARSVLNTQAAPQAQVALEVSPVFNQGLSLGMSHSDIKRLQQLLNSDPDTRVALSGVGSSGNETNYFGSLTEQAVQKFQVKHGVAGPGDPGYGYVGPKTRAKLQEVF